ncbi:hypothetical protein [Streptomyces sp. ATCC 21386]|uniref:hypothetical protein n=1 Tax=Streptomyces sp. ATCC 21386 TaxID=2699428 RepID=UPI001BFFCAA2|nr:hypothetical protein [Streptomyces sp. ATCC 21386]
MKVTLPLPETSSGLVAQHAGTREGGHRVGRFDARAVQAAFRTGSPERVRFTSGHLARIHRNLRLPVGDMTPDDHRIRHIGAVLLGRSVDPALPFICTQLAEYA